MGDALTASSCDGGHDEGPEEELRMPRIGRARRLAWEPESAPKVHHDRQASSTREGQVLHHFVQEEHLGPTVAELEALRLKKQRWRCRYLSCQLYLQPLQELPETPVLELQPVSPASVPAEPEDVPAVASVPVLAASPWDIPGVVSGPELERHEPSGPGPRSPARMAPGLIEPEVDPEPTSPCAASTPCAVTEEPPTILQFSPRLVAEQLTLMCAELFTKLTYSEWKANLWHQAPTRTIEHLAPTIHQIRQSGATANVVTSSCLRTPSMTARDRAQVVEFWIRVAKECLALRNFAALHAILYALQRPAIRRLESTWGHVSWQSSWIYKKLKKRDKGLKRKQLLKEARATVKQQLWAPKGSQDRKKQGMVPFLGVFLDDLYADKLLEHREDVTLILNEIMVYKGLAALYDLDPENHFLSFFRSVEHLDEEQSYTLSCQLEPECQRNGRKGLLQFFRRHKI